MLLGNIPTLVDLDFKEKRVFLRVDFNCPIKNGRVTDDTRIKSALPTLNHLLETGAKVVIGSHLGRPKGKRDLNYSLAPVAERLQELTDLEVIFVDDPLSDAPNALLKQLKENQVILLENLRFSPDEKEKTGKLSAKVGSYTDIYINDAFGVCHRSDSSVIAFPEMVKKRGAGFLIEKEILALSEVRDNPEAPFGLILGGAKVSDKLPMIDKLMEKTDVFVIGGAMAFTFLKAKGVPVGNSLVEEDLVGTCKTLIRRMEQREKVLLLPTDFYVGDSPNDESSSLCQVIPENKMGLDVGPLSVKAFVNELKRCKTILWNGPMGVFENPSFEFGTKELCKGLSEMNSKRVVGGGDSAAAAVKFGGSFDHISTGGGASLTFLEGKVLPGLEALRIKRKEMLEETRYTLQTFSDDELKKNKESLEALSELSSVNFEKDQKSE
jgi:phosphoglycerate kinase